ncbi:MAG: family 65 glycosyl hydrolase domain-containing protein [Bacteroidia bacterium]|nr:family 65 glycosyl hydrolase domain-containing protein [Bacteroidia bacterium]
MKNYYKLDEWRIVEEGFQPEYHEAAESIFSLGNGKMGQRAMFEEKYSGKSLQGSYVAGVYYPDKTRVGWWKNGYPEYFAKVLNSVNWIGMDIRIDSESMDLFVNRPKQFVRVLDMKSGLLQRSFSYVSSTGKSLDVQVERFISREDDEIACIRYELKANEDMQIDWNTFVDAHVKNKDSNYDELFWSRISEQSGPDFGLVRAQTTKLNFEVCAAFHASLTCIDSAIEQVYTHSDWRADSSCSFKLAKGETAVLIKTVAVVSSLNYAKNELEAAAIRQLNLARQKGYDELKAKHVASWADVWKYADIAIEGDTAAQQGIRFNIFQLNQTYTGRDPRLNIGPKGFTGEKYGGSTYWDTEAYCIPFYLGTSDPAIARQLLVYRYKQLDKAIENAAKLGFTKGAALYPMVTMNGEECHNEWEITFEEIHRNGAIAFAIFQYALYTGDKSYLSEGGAEVLLGISRFWSQRVHWSERKKQFVMHGVTGPNEYENNVNNNWYTNYIAMWCLKYTAEVIGELKADKPDYYSAFAAKTNFQESELADWKQRWENMFYPSDEELGIFLQQEGYLDKEQRMATDLDPAERPINQHWSWDRILRSCFIKQADVLQGLFLFEDHFDKETLRRNFDFYEPRTVHESSLSPCIHVVQAAKLGYEQKAYELYLRTSRLDLDDYNKEVHEGLHITSMAGTWMAVVMGFGGLRIEKDLLSFAPMVPSKWKGFSFRVHYRGANILVRATEQGVSLSLEDKPQLRCKVYGKEVTLHQSQVFTTALQHA